MLRSQRLAQALSEAPSRRRALFATIAAFATYFCMYAFRKPFSVGQWEGRTFLGTGLTLKSAYVLAQLLGYVLSKYIGVRIVPALARERRFLFLMASLSLSALGLGLFALAPNAAGAFALVLSALPLGMVWGVVLSYLEGRQESEAMMAGLSCSFIVASGVVKDVGRVVLSWGVGENAMPLVCAGLFALPFAISAWLLDHTPPASDADVSARSQRHPMDRLEQRAFLRRYLPGLAALAIVYIGLTALRDYRDNYAIDILVERGHAGGDAVFSRMELPSALAVMLVFGATSWIRGNASAFRTIATLIRVGLLGAALATLLYQQRVIGPVMWLGAVGVGMYLAYVPFGSMLFERLMAHTRAAGTLVLAAQLLDALGYTGSAAFVLAKDLLAAGSSRAEFFEQSTLGLGFVGTGLMIYATGYFFAPGGVKLARRGGWGPTPQQANARTAPT